MEAEQPKVIDLTATVNEEGHPTLEDLLTHTLMAFGEKGLFVGGIVIDPENPSVARVFVHGSREAIQASLEIGLSMLTDGKINKQTKINLSGSLN